MKRGKIGIPLDDNIKQQILKIMNRDFMTCKDMAKKIGISYYQLYEPLSGGQNCSRESYLKFKKFLKKIERQDG